MSDMGKSALLFARDMIEWAWEDGPSTEEAQTILDMATAKGLVHWRKPTQAELNDQEWWGHEFDIGPEDAQVGEFTSEFRAALANAKPEPVT